MDDNIGTSLRETVYKNENWNKLILLVSLVNFDAGGGGHRVIYFVRYLVRCAKHTINIYQLKVDAAGSSVLTTYETTRCHALEDFSVWRLYLWNL
jgi:hypothetical protein